MKILGKAPSGQEIDLEEMIKLFCIPFNHLKLFTHQLKSKVGSNQAGTSQNRDELYRCIAV